MSHISESEQREHEERTAEMLEALTEQAEEAHSYGLIRSPWDDLVWFPPYWVKSRGQRSVIHQPAVVIRPENLSIGDDVRVDSFCKLECGRGLRIGNGVHVASFVHLGVGGGETILGDFSAVASGGKVISGSNQPDAPSMSASAPKDLQRVTASVTRIGRFAFVGTNAVVLPGVTLHEGAVLAAGAVATKDVGAWEIHAGVPARLITRRVARVPR